jgi:AraC-like DNA-binding protein
MEYLHRLRIEAAKRLLETSDLNVQEITSRVGYQDARSFSRLFRAGTGQSPGEYRARFGSNLDALEGGTRFPSIRVSFHSATDPAASTRS